MDEDDEEDSTNRPVRRSTLPTLLPSDEPGQEVVATFAPNFSNTSSSIKDNQRKRGGRSGVNANANVNANVNTAKVVIPRESVRPPKRKKSLPDSQELPKQLQGMSREEASTLLSNRIEELQREEEEAEKYRANPFLYIFSPGVKEWFSRYQLMIVVLLFNLGLAIMFFKLLS